MPALRLVAGRGAADTSATGRPALDAPGRGVIDFSWRCSNHSAAPPGGGHRAARDDRPSPGSGRSTVHMQRMMRVVALAAMTIGMASGAFAQVGSTGTIEVF